MSKLDDIYAADNAILPYRYQTKYTHYYEDAVKHFPKLRITGVHVPNEPTVQGKYPTFHDEYKDNLEYYGNEVKGYLLEVGYCRQYIMENCVKVRVKSNPTRTTYGWKHKVEDWLRARPNADAAACYISNGAFLAACILEGSKVAAREGSPNAIPYIGLKDEK